MSYCFDNTETRLCMYLISITGLDTPAEEVGGRRWVMSSREISKGFLMSDTQQRKLETEVHQAWRASVR